MIQDMMNLIGRISKDRIQRKFKLSTDTCKEGDLMVSIYSPVESVPDPSQSVLGKQMLGGISCP
jgi:hypothetical protein